MNTFQISMFMLMIVSLEYYIASSIRLSCYKTIVDSITCTKDISDKTVLEEYLKKKKRADIIFYCILGAFAILDITGVIIWIKLV